MHDLLLGEFCLIAFVALLFLVVLNDSSMKRAENILLVNGAAVIHL